MAGDATIPFGPFPRTQTTLLALARRPDDSGRAALEDFLRRYLPALKAHLVLRKGLSRDKANDLLQGFVADRVITGKLLDHVVRGKGKFRTFLLTVLDRYVIDAHRAATARKRSPGQDAILDVERVGDADLPTAGTPDPFVAEWARGVLGEVLRRMKDECLTRSRSHVWEVFRKRTLLPATESTKPTPYDQLVEELKLRSAGEACNLLVTAKRMFQRVLRSVVSEYAASETDVEEEIRELRAVLSGRGA